MTNSSTPVPFILSDRAYSILKWVAAIVFPACGTLYFALAQIWGLPSGEQVLGTMLAVQTFLGVVLGISSIQYQNSGAKYDGEINVQKTHEDKMVASMELKGHPEELLQKDKATFKINS